MKVHQQKNENKKRGRKNRKTVSLLGEREEQPTVATDDDTISRAQFGDEEAFVNLMRTHYAFVYAIVIGIVNNPQDAEEVVQDTFLNAYRGLPDLEDTKKFKNWLGKIARNRALNWQREQRIDTVSINEVGEHTLSSSDAPDEQLIHREQRELIRRAIETLSPKEREVARSYYIEGASYDELTKAHGLSYKAVSVRLSRAKQKLSKRLGHLLAGVFVIPASTLKKISSGGLTIMKVGTVPKITAGAVAIIILAYIGTRQFISSKEDSSPSVEIVTSTESAQSVTQTDTTLKGAVTAPPREAKPQISAEEMQQIEDFFAQLDEADAQSGANNSQNSSEPETETNVADANGTNDGIKLSAEAVMNTYVEGLQNLDFESMLQLVTGDAKVWVESQLRGLNHKISEEEQEFMLQGILKELESKQVPEEAMGVIIQEFRRKMHPQEQQNKNRANLERRFGQVEVVSGKHVGEEFHFRLRTLGPPVLAEMPEEARSFIPKYIDALVKMHKVDGAWQIYESEDEAIYR